MQRTLLAIALCSVMAAGCGGGTTRYLQKGIDRYDRADYSGAMNDFSAASSGEHSLNQKALARYFVYRGLTEYHLGQRQEALTDLNRGKEVYSRGPAGVLPSAISAELDKALADLASADTTAPASPPPASPASTTTATPATPPPPSTGEALVPTKNPPPAKTATATPVKTSSPPTKTLSSSQSTSPK